MKWPTLLILIALLLAFCRQSHAQLGVGEERLAPASSGRLIGRVAAVGNYQKPKALPVFKNRSFCGPAVPNETLLTGKDGALRNAVIVLHSATRTVPAEPGQLILDNKKCAFAPHVQVAALGSEVLLKNSDPILHTVHARLGGETLFNVGLPKWRQVIKRLDRPGIIRIDCDVLHTWMSAAIVVTDTPYHAISDERGAFAFADLPIGSYDMEVWHEKLGTLRQRIRIDKGAAAEFDIVYSLDQVR